MICRLVVVASLALMACGRVLPEDAAASAEAWAVDLDFQIKAIHCKPETCGAQGCLCTLRVDCAVFPLECGAKSCEVRIR